MLGDLAEVRSALTTSRALLERALRSAEFNDSELLAVAAHLRSAALSMREVPAWEQAYLAVRGAIGRLATVTGVSLSGGFGMLFPPPILPGSAGPGAVTAMGPIAVQAPLVSQSSRMAQELRPVLLLVTTALRYLDGKPRDLGASPQLRRSRITVGA